VTIRGACENEMSSTNIGGRVLLAILAACSFGLPVFAQKKQVRVAAASDLQTVLPEIASAFEARTGKPVEVVYGSSGNFYAQIQNGAPFDVFLSADSDYPRKLEEAGFAEPHTAVVYGLGRMVLWMRMNSYCNPERDGWKCLLLQEVKRIGVANPKHAPYGRAAIAALQKAGIYEQVRAKLVFGENISQAAQFAESGNAQAAILAYSLMSSPSLRSGNKWEIPMELYPPIEQSAVVLKSGQNRSAAQEFVKFITQGRGHDLLEKCGFWPPERNQKTP
jgi:molybdate transport system substrate-binding protein